MPERLHTHHLVESKVKKESSKIPIRLDSPPKRMETLAEQQVISISRVKTSPSKRSKKHDLSKSSNVYHNDPMEDAEYSKSTGENILEKFSFSKVNPDKSNLFSFSSQAHHSVSSH